MTEETIFELTKLKIEEHEKNRNKEPIKYIMTKEQIIDFCIKLMKVVENIENMEGDYERIRENQDISI